MVPSIANEAEFFLNIDRQLWSGIKETLTDHQINDYKPLLMRLKTEDVDAMIDASK